MNNSNQQEHVLIDVQDVTYTHWNQTEPTLINVSLEIHKGTLNVLVGPSGSGKSTLCALFNGVIPHLHGGSMLGTVTITGKDTREIEVRDLALEVGYVFQDPEVMFSMLYVEDEIAFGPENMRMDVDQIKEIVEQQLVFTDLKDRRENLVWNLSGGQIQKLGLACVLAMRPKVIVLDEPTSNLDPGATRSVHDLILNLNAEGITIVLVTRELDEFLIEADQLIVMESGNIIAAGPPRHVLAEQGRYMIESLGVWLPETSEIGIELAQLGLISPDQIPITLDETRDAMRSLTLSDIDTRNWPEPILKQSEKGQSPLISAQDLQFSYPGGVQALKGVSLNINPAEWLMILGRNGAGKSTLSRLLVGLDKPEFGALSLFGRDAREWKVPDLANHIALVFQNPEHQFLTDSIADELEYSLLAKGIIDPEEINLRKNEMLQLLGLQDFTNLHPLSLSAGLKRRLGVATMLVGKPSILLVDEPTYGQDKAMTHTLMELMQKIQAQGVAVVMITHDMRLVQEYAERVIVMSDGLILFDGHYSQLFELRDLLEKANLRRTLLHELLEVTGFRSTALGKPIRRTNDLVDLVASLSIKED